MNKDLPPALVDLSLSVSLANFMIVLPVIVLPVLVIFSALGCKSKSVDDFNNPRWETSAANDNCTDHSRGVCTSEVRMRTCVTAHAIGLSFIPKTTCNH